MRLPRRTFLGLLAGFAAIVVSVARAWAWPSWWRKAADEQDAAPTGAAPLTAQAAAGSIGVKITTERRTWLTHVTPGFNRDPDVYYIQGELRRWERPRSYSRGGASQETYGPRIVTIVRPDLGKMFELNLDSHEYSEGPYPPPKPAPLTRAEMEARGIKLPPSPVEAAKPTFRIETTTNDTGERKQMFGYTARHVITTTKEIPLEGSTRPPRETVTDAWYIDLESQFYPGLSPRNLQLDASGKPRRAHAYLSASPAGSSMPQEVPEFVDIGEPENGFPIEETRSSRSDYTTGAGRSGQSEVKTETTVTIEKSTYAPAMFEIPRGFRQVAEIDRRPI